MKTENTPEAKAIMTVGIRRLLRGIAWGYLIKNYSESFRKRTKVTGVYRLTHHQGRKIPEGKSVYEVLMFACDEFAIRIDLDAKTIVHYGPYGKNRGFDSALIIDHCLQKFKFDTEKA